jgi:hypothetical protein
MTSHQDGGTFHGRRRWRPSNPASEEMCGRWYIRNMKMCVSFLSAQFLFQTFFAPIKHLATYAGDARWSLSDFNPNLGGSTDLFLIMYTNIKFHQNPFTCSAVVRYSRTGVYMGKQVGAFLHIFVVNAPCKLRNTRISTLIVHIFHMRSCAMYLKIIFSSYLTENTLCL